MTEKEARMVLWAGLSLLGCFGVGLLAFLAKNAPEQTYTPTYTRPAQASLPPQPRVQPAPPASQAGDRPLSDLVDQPRKYGPPQNYACVITVSVQEADGSPHHSSGKITVEAWGDRIPDKYYKSVYNGVGGLNEIPIPCIMAYADRIEMTVAHFHGVLTSSLAHARYVAEHGGGVLNPHLLVFRARPHY